MVGSSAPLSQHFRHLSAHLVAKRIAGIALNGTA